MEWGHGLDAGAMSVFVESRSGTGIGELRMTGKRANQYKTNFGSNIALAMRASGEVGAKVNED